MYIKTKCPICYGGLFLDVKVDYTESNGELIPSFMDVRDVCDCRVLEDSIIDQIKPHIHDGVRVRDVAHLLEKYFGISDTHCCDLVQSIKIKLDMYCPDRQHLYFVRN
jgi:hypothetical protein